MTSAQTKLQASNSAIQVTNFEKKIETVMTWGKTYTKMRNRKNFRDCYWGVNDVVYYYYITI